MKLLVLAAGLGSRFGGIKQLAAVGPRGETLLEYNIFNAVEAGFDSVVFLLRKDIEEDFANLVLSRLPAALPVELAFQSGDSCIPEALRGGLRGAGREKPWGTGHALLCARQALEGGPFAVMNADDFYGKKGLAAIHGFLAAPGRTGAEFCLPGYRMGAVVSPKGSVSRAICSTGPGGLLEKIVEHTRVEMREEGILSIKADGSRERISPDSVASMNLWGLSPAVFPWAERLFSEFLSDRSHWAKAEFYLPTVIGKMIDAGAAKAWVLPVDEEYFGLTNPEDIVTARQALAGQVERGEYPSPLWPGKPTSQEVRR